MELRASIPKLRPARTTSMIRPSREKSENRPDGLLWLDKNENIDPIYIQHIQKMMVDIPPKALFGYPDCYSLYKKLSEYLHTPINQLFLAAGSDGVIRAVYEAFVSPGDTVIYTEPTFAMYALYAQMLGANSVLLHYQPSDQGPVLSIDNVIHAIQTTQPKLICLPNPNSPSGTIFSPDELRDIIIAAEKSDAIILIDEAYYPFYPETALPWINDYSHLIIARTFSKAWGCAGLRLGFSIACKELTSDLHTLRPMYEAGALSMMLGERLLDHADAMLASVQRLNAGKKYFLAEMSQLGLRTFRSEGNFLHVAFDQHASAVHTGLADKALYRNDFAHASLAGYSRFTATIQELYLPIVEQIKTIIQSANSIVHKEIL